jgi:hypothetical protein
MLPKLKPIDYMSSLVAAFLWFLGGLLFLGIVRATFLYAIPISTRNNNKATLGTLFLILLFSAFIAGVWFATKRILPLFMKRTNQINGYKTATLFLKISALSILGLMLGDAINHESLVISYGFWFATLASLYLYARYRTLN